MELAGFAGAGSGDAWLDGAEVSTTARDAPDVADDAATREGAGDSDGAEVGVGVGAGVAVGDGLTVGRTVGLGDGLTVGRTVGLGVADAALTTIVPNICSGCTWQK